jgi:acetyl esterase/lipase
MKNPFRQQNRIVHAYLLLVCIGITSATLFANATPACEQTTETEFKIWPDKLPAGATKFSAEQIAKLKTKKSSHLTYVQQPTLTAYLPAAETANGCAVIVCPGGGYNVLAHIHEGSDIAKWFNSFGVTAFVLKYRVPRRTKRIYWEPMQDVQRAIRLIRHDAEKWHIDPQRLGVLGFSAGGHLTVMSGVQSETKCYEPTDAADQMSARPNFICPIYAAYLADGYQDNVAELGPLITVDKQTPPTFMAVTWDDKLRGAQSALLFSRLREHDVPAELHAYSVGGHGYGIRESENPVSTWHHHLQAWLKVSGFLSAGKTTAEKGKKK